MSELGDRLREVREDWLEASLRGLADRLSEARGEEIKHSTVNSYEHGKTVPNAEYLRLFCRELDVSPAWLLLNEGPKRWSEAREEGYGGGQSVARAVMGALGHTIPEELFRDIVRDIEEGGEIDEEGVDAHFPLDPDGDAG